MSEIVAEAITGLCTIAVAIIGYITARATKRLEQSSAKSEKQACLRQKENLLLLQMMDANTQLTTATANAVLGGHNNGNVEAAYKAVQESSAAYKAFANEVVAHQVAK